MPVTWSAACSKACPNASPTKSETVRDMVVAAIDGAASRLSSEGENTSLAVTQSLEGAEGRLAALRDEAHGTLTDLIATLGDVLSSESQKARENVYEAITPSKAA